MDFTAIAEDVFAFTKELVAIPSYETERHIASHILDTFDRLGLRGDAIGGDLNHPSIISLTTKPNSKKTILLEAPLDTTPLGSAYEWQHNPLDVFVDTDNKAYGLGIADAKLAIAMYTYLAFHLQQDAAFNGSLFLAFDAQEQNGKFSGIREIIPYLPKLDGAFLGYQSYNKIHIGARGWVRLKLISHGQSAHTGSTKKKGVNAVHNLILLAEAILKLKLEASEPYFEYGSRVNISVIQGGNAVNVVPNKAELLIDIRITPQQKPLEIVSCVQNTLFEVTQQHPDIQYDLEVFQAEQAYLSNPHDRLITTLHTVFQQETKRDIPLVTSGPGSVGNVLSQLNIPIINAFGVDSDGVHAANEWIDITTIEPVFRTLYKTIKQFCDS